MTNNLELIYDPETQQLSCRCSDLLTAIYVNDNHSKKYGPIKDLAAYTAFLGDPTTHVLPLGKYTKVEASLPFAAPYFERFCQWVGVAEFNERVDVTAGIDRVKHTHAVEKLELVDCGMEAVGYMPIHKGKEEDYTLEKQLRRCYDVFGMCFGTQEIEREYIEKGGRVMHNPDYGRKWHRPKPGIQEHPSRDAEGLWRAMWRHWLAKYATPGQAKLYNDVIVHNTFPDDQDRYARIKLRDYNVYVFDPNGKVNYFGDGRMVAAYSREEFRLKLQEIKANESRL